MRLHVNHLKWLPLHGYRSSLLTQASWKQYGERLHGISFHRSSFLKSAMTWKREKERKPLYTTYMNPKMHEMTQGTTRSLEESWKSCNEWMAMRLKSTRVISDPRDSDPGSCQWWWPSSNSFRVELPLLLPSFNEMFLTTEVSCCNMGDHVRFLTNATSGIIFGKSHSIDESGRRFPKAF